MITIHLESDSLYLHGSPEDSAGTEIRGCLEVCFKEATRVKSISLQFTGILKLHWEEGATKTLQAPHRRQHKIKKTILQHDWAFLQVRKWPHMLEANTSYRYPFDLVLPGDIAASVSSSEGGSHGFLSYEFKATVTRPLTAKNLTVYRPIRVIRRSLLQQQQDEQLQSALYREASNDTSLVTQNTFGDKVKYRIQLDKAIYQRGQPIRIQFVFNPLVQGLRIRHISCFLKEYTALSYPTASSESSSSSAISTESSLERHQQSRIISLARDDCLPCHGQEWKITETLVIPRSTQSVQMDLDHPLIRIDHKLRFTINFVQPQGQVSELRVTMPIRLLETVSSPSTTHLTTVSSQQLDRPRQGLCSLDDLPRYEDACLSAPYFPQQHLGLSSPSSPVPSLPGLVYHNIHDTSSPYDDEEDEHLTGENHWHSQQTTTRRDHATTTGNTTTSCYSSAGDYFSYHPCHLQRVPSYDTAIRSPI